MTSIFKGRDQPVRPHGRSSSAMPTPLGATAVLEQHLRCTIAAWSMAYISLMPAPAAKTLSPPYRTMARRSGVRPPR
jgi:hypothetical protein